ncbi:hypothetical protein [Pseudomonas sp. BJa3]|uniref:hypothetical protein n=1 Tax=Pseudomonas sp. BJa3 TaxID=2986525 RepID=UPI002265CC4B|nr:hypothetical protein [Pseudomonas sp. BJa3]MCX5509510.1 hypothetical protein [Pseudomonas sp. BJa3]
MKSRATYFSIFMGLLVVSSFSACTTVPSTKSDHEIRVVTFTQRYMRGDDCLTVVGQGENIMCRATRNKMIDSIALSNLPKGHMELCFQTESRVNALCIEGELDKEYRERFLISLRPLETSLLSPYRVTRSNRDLFDKIEFIQYSAPQGFAGK